MTILEKATFKSLPLNNVAAAILEHALFKSHLLQYVMIALEHVTCNAYSRISYL